MPCVADWLNCPLSIIHGIFGEGGKIQAQPGRQAGGRRPEGTRQGTEREGKEGKKESQELGWGRGGRRKAAAKSVCAALKGLKAEEERAWLGKAELYRPGAEWALQASSKERELPPPPRDLRPEFHPFPILPRMGLNSEFLWDPFCKIQGLPNQEFEWH